MSNRTYDILIMLPPPILVQREVFVMDLALSFIVAVAAGVVCHYIIKWLDNNK